MPRPPSPGRRAAAAPDGLVELGPAGRRRRGRARCARLAAWHSAEKSPSLGLLEVGGGAGWQKPAPPAVDEPITLRRRKSSRSSLAIRSTPIPTLIAGRSPAPDTPVEVSFHTASSAATSSNVSQRRSSVTAVVIRARPSARRASYGWSLCEWTNQASAGNSVTMASMARPAIGDATNAAATSATATTADAAHASQCGRLGSGTLAPGVQGQPLASLNVGRRWRAGNVWRGRPKQANPNERYAF